MALDKRMQNLKNAVIKIQSAKTIAISCHINPDGDCIGSLLALGLGLEKSGKNVYMLSPGPIPYIYRNLPGSGGIIKKPDKVPDLAIAVDCGVKEMLGSSWKTFKRSRDILEIDHHAFRRPFGSVSYVDNKAAAVGEMIYSLLKALRIQITEDIAENLLTSIIVETNSFRLPGVRPITFMACAQLVKTGVDFHKLSEMIYWSRSKEATWISGYCLAKCELLYADKIAWSMVTAKDFKKFKAKDEHVDSVANDMLSIKGVEVAVFFREKNQKFLRVSLRSKGSINVAAIAEEFGGGGHFDVAGCFIKNKPGFIRKMLDSVKSKTADAYPPLRGKHGVSLG